MSKKPTNQELMLFRVTFVNRYKSNEIFQFAVYAKAGIIAIRRLTLLAQAFCPFAIFDKIENIDISEDLIFFSPKIFPID